MSNCFASAGAAPCARTHLTGKKTRIGKSADDAAKAQQFYTDVPVPAPSIGRLFFFHLYRLYPHASDAVAVKFESFSCAHTEIYNSLP